MTSRNLLFTYVTYSLCALSLGTHTPKKHACKTHTTSLLVYVSCLLSSGLMKSTHRGHLNWSVRSESIYTDKQSFALTDTRCVFVCVCFTTLCPKGVCVCVAQVWSQKFRQSKSALYLFGRDGGQEAGEKGEEKKKKQQFWLLMCFKEMREKNKKAVTEYLQTLGDD